MIYVFNDMIYTVASEPPIVRRGTATWGGSAAHCPDCDHILLDFVHEKRVMLYCWHCYLIWPTPIDEKANTSRAKMVESIVAPDAQRARWRARCRRYYLRHREDILAHKAQRRAEEAA